MSDSIFTPEFMTEQVKLIAMESLPFRIRPSDHQELWDRFSSNAKQLWTGNLTDGWFVCDGMADHEANYLLSAANNYPAALAEIVKLRAELAAAKEAERWIPVTERMPKTKQRVDVILKTKNGYSLISVADYIAPRTVLEEDWIDPDYATGEFVDYDEENDTYWAPAGFYESEITTDVNWFIDPDQYEVTHWRPLPAAPEVENG